MLIGKTTIVLCFTPVIGSNLFRRDIDRHNAFDLDLDPRSQFYNSAHYLDMENNSAKFH